MKFFMSDTHFGNHKIVKMMARVNGEGKLFATSEEHDDYVIQQINDKVSADDELFIIGDFADENPEGFRKRINSRKVRLIVGNHDSRKGASSIFQGVHDYLMVNIRGGERKNSLNVVCSHYPMAYWDGSHKGYGHLYGHVHGQRDETLDNLFQGRRAFDIGIDSIYNMTGKYAPLSEEEVYDRLTKTDGHDIVSFYHKYQNNLYKEREITR